MTTPFDKDIFESQMADATFHPLMLIKRNLVQLKKDYKVLADWHNLNDTVETRCAIKLIKKQMKANETALGVLEEFML